MRERRQDSLGSGGPRAELYDDVSVRLPPLEPGDLELMLDELRCGRLLRSAEHPGWDLPALAEAIQAFSRLALDLGDLDVELDVNPLFVRRSGLGVVAADAALVARPMTTY